MKLTDKIIEMFLKGKGLVGESNNIDIEVTIPSDTPTRKDIKITISADNVKINVRRDED